MQSVTQIRIILIVLGNHNSLKFVSFLGGKCESFQESLLVIYREIWIVKIEFFDAFSSRSCQNLHSYDILSSKIVLT